MKIITKNAYTIALVLIFLFALILNCWTPYIADDYAYALSWMDGKKITTVSQLFPSIYAHAFSMNGRLVPHFIVQFFMLFPKMIFNIVNAGMFAFLFYRLGKNVGIDGTYKLDGVLILIIFTIYWHKLPAFGQVNLWMDGSCNYLWAYALAVLFLAPFFELLLKGEWQQKQGTVIGYAVLSFFFGNFSENVGLAAIGGATLVLILVKFLYKNTIPKCLIMNLLLAFFSYVFIYICPAQIVNKAGTSDLIQLKENVYNYFSYMYINCKELLVLWGILLVWGIYSNISRKKMILSVVCILMALAANFIFVFASYYPERCFAGVIVFIIQAIAILMAELKNKKEVVFAILCFVICFNSILTFMEGVRDVHSLYEQGKRREELIVNQIEAGEENIVIPEFTSTTKYSARSGLKDVVADPMDWPNNSMAIYYDVKSIVKE